jgi:hypothetical protein
MKFVHRVVIGDWSHDGHSHAQYFSFRATHDRLDVVKGYNQAVKEMGIALHESDGPALAILSEYLDNLLREGEMEVLRQHGIDLSRLASRASVDGTIPCTPQDVAILMFEFVRTQVPGFQYERRCLAFNMSCLKSLSQSTAFTSQILISLLVTDAFKADKY